VLVAPNRLVVIDWFDACRGDPLGDIARTSILLGDLGAAMFCPDHLPGVTLGVLEQVYGAYRARILHDAEFTPLDLTQHHVTALAARLAEGLERDVVLDAWRRSKLTAGARPATTSTRTGRGS
jgi:hypothetical protein